MPLRKRYVPPVGMEGSTCRRNVVEFVKRHFLVDGSAAQLQSQKQTVLYAAKLRKIRLLKSLFYRHFNHSRKFFCSLYVAMTDSLQVG